MSKKIYITESQSNILKEMLDISSSSLPLFLVNEIENGDFPFSNSQYFPLDPKIISIKLLNTRFKEINEYFNEDLSNITIEEVENKISKLLNICIKKEKNIRPQLEKLCWDSLVELFNIPEGAINFSCELSDVIDASTSFHIVPESDKDDFEYDSIKAIDNETSEIEKRKILISLIIGGAMSLSNIVMKHILNKIFDLDETLPHLYSKIIKLNELLLFLKSIKITDKQHFQAGYTKVFLGGENELTKISVKARIFPILLMESIRGLMELFTSHGLPDSLQETKSIISKADVLVDEPWHMRIGPLIWKRLFGKIENLNSEDIPDVLQYLSMLDSKELQDVFKENIANTKKGKELISRIIKTAKYQKEKDEFDNDMLKKQTDAKSLISDAYFTEEELADF